MGLLSGLRSRLTLGNKHTLKEIDDDDVRPGSSDR